MKVDDEQIILWAQAKKILADLEKDRTLGYEQKNALEQLKKFSKIPKKDVEELKTKLGKIEKLKEKHIIALINMLPRDADEVKLLFANEPINLSEDERKKIASITKSFG